MAMNQNLLKILESQIGVEEATGNNDGVPAERYNHGEKKPWCAALLVWAFIKAGIPLPGNKWKNAGVSNLEDACRRADVWSDDLDEIQPGDIFFCGNRGDSDGGRGASGRHVGFVVDVDLNAGTIETIEGNVGNECARQTRKLFSGWIVSWARWPRVEAEKTEPSDTTPVRGGSCWPV